MLLALGAAGVVAETTEGATIPKATYVKRADAICLDVATKAVALQSEARRRVGAATSRAEVRRIFVEIYRRQLGLIQSMRRRLVAIGTPRGAAATARALVVGIRSGEDALRDVIMALENGADAAPRARSRATATCRSQAPALSSGRHSASGLVARACDEPAARRSCSSSSTRFVRPSPRIDAPPSETTLSGPSSMRS